MSFSPSFAPHTVKPSRHYDMVRKPGVICPVMDVEAYLLCCKGCGSRRRVRASKAMRLQLSGKKSTPCECGSSFKPMGAFSFVHIHLEDSLAPLLLDLSFEQWWTREHVGLVVPSDLAAIMSNGEFVRWMEHHAPTILRGKHWVGAVRAFLIDAGQDPSRLNIPQVVLLERRSLKNKKAITLSEAAELAKSGPLACFLGQPTAAELAQSERRKSLMAGQLPLASATMGHAILILPGQFYPVDVESPPKVTPELAHSNMEDIHQNIRSTLDRLVPCLDPRINQYLDRNFEVVDGARPLIQVDFRGFQYIHRLASSHMDVYVRAIELAEITARTMLNAAAKAARERDVAKHLSDPEDPYPGLVPVHLDDRACIGDLLLRYRLAQPAAAYAYACDCPELHLLSEQEHAQGQRRPDLCRVCKDCQKEIGPAQPSAVMSVFPRAVRQHAQKAA